MECRGALKEVIGWILGRHGRLRSVVVSALVALMVAPTAEAAYSGGDGMIAWASRGLQDEVRYGIVAYSIIVAKADGSGAFPITINDGNTGHQDVSATWSPDGNQL